MFWRILVKFNLTGDSSEQEFSLQRNGEFYNHFITTVFFLPSTFDNHIEVFLSLT
jgi:hypothetical protein